MENFEDSGRQSPLTFKEQIGIALGMVLCLASVAGFFLVTLAYLGG